MKYKSLLLTLIFMIASSWSALQAAQQEASDQQKPARQRSCDTAEGKRFDFWLGEWDLTWPAGQGDTPAGQVGNGTNSIRKILGDCVIQESFRSPATGLEGLSFSAYASKSGEWQQTWVDSEGSYLLFNGRFKNGTMELRSPRTLLPRAKQLLAGWSLKISRTILSIGTTSTHLMRARLGLTHGTSTISGRSEP
jgi:hypothetical protein